jgi:hypothetical protein
MFHFLAGACGAGGVDLFLSSVAGVVVEEAGLSASSPKPRFRIVSGAMRFLLLGISCLVVCVLCSFRCCVPLHSTLQVAFAQLATGIVVDSSMAAKAFEVLLHNRLAFCFVVEREGTSLWWDGFGGDLATACEWSVSTPNVC